MNNRNDSIYKSITKKNILFIFAVGAVLGAIVFLFIYGITPLKFWNDSWLLSGGDLSQHYLGWCFYRNSDWQYPIGMVDGLLYPEKVCITYTDSIPLFALIFKIISPILPTTFQYFGLWGIICYMMMGGLASTIIRKATTNYYLCWCGSLFFIVTPYMLQRMFRHTSLSGQWVLLAAILIIVYKPYFSSVKRRLIAWSSLMFIATFVHIYFTPMIAIFMLGSCLEDIFCQRKIKDNILILIASCIPTGIGLKLFGAFEGGSSLNDIGLGEYSANLNTLWNSQGRTVGRILPPMEQLKGQYEGLGYLGFGMLLLLLIVIIYKIISRFVSSDYKLINSESKWLQRNSLKVSMIIIGLFFSLFALSPTFTYGKNILFTIPFPDFVLKLWSIFRSTGRFIWPVDYIIMTFTVMAVVKFKKKQFGTILVAGCLVLQLYDLSPFIIKTKNWFSSIQPNEITLNDPLWHSLGNTYKHIEYYPYNFTEAFPMWMYTFADYAKDYQMTLNYFFCARVNREKLDYYQHLTSQNFNQGNAQVDTIYVFPDYETALGSGLKIFQMDGFNVGIKE